jgi:hypothetical protein
MPDHKNGKQFYELTREKPYGIFHMILVGGTACAVLAFLMVSLIGAYEGLPIDSIILAFLTAVLLGFLTGGVMTWLGIKYIGPILEKMDQEKIDTLSENLILEPAIPLDSSAPIESSEEKGQTVDFVFPEISPDQQG